MLLFNSFRNKIFQKEFVFYLYSVLLLVCAIYFFLVISAIFYPEYFVSIKQYFILDTSNLNTNVFFSSYTHTNLNHLGNNILSYSILLWLVFKFVNNKEKLKSLMIMCLLIFPLINSIFLASFSDVRAGGGLSGIVACLNGYLLFAGYYDLKKRLQLNLSMFSVIMLVTFNLLFAQYFVTKCYFLLLFTIVVFLIFIHENKENIKLMFKNIQNLEPKYLVDNLPCLTLWVFAFIFSLTAFRMFAPVFPTGLSIYYPVHYFGWFYGLTVSWLILK